MAREIKPSNPNHNVPEKIDLSVLIDDAWRGIKKLWLLFVIIIALCAGGNGFYHRHSFSPDYMAYTTFVVKAYSVYEGDGSSYYDSKKTSQMAETFPYLLKSSTLRHLVEKSLGESEIYETIEASASSENSPLFTIKVYSSDPLRAYDVLQAVIENYSKVSEPVIGQTEMEIMDESGVPEHSYNSLSTRHAVILGGGVGSVISIALIVLYALTRKTVRRESDLERHTSLIYLGSIPFKKLKSRSKNANKRILYESMNSDEGFNESIRRISGRVVREMKRQEGKVLLVSSAMAGEGKSTVAANLAVALAKKKYRVFLMDGDLRNPTIHRIFEIENDYSVMEQILTGKKKGKISFERYNDLPLMIFPGGPSTLSEKPVIREDYLSRVIDLFKDKSDFIIIDTPPCGVVSDTMNFAHVSDVALLVVKQDYSSIDKIIQSAENLSSCGISTISYVLNHASAGITAVNSYGYGYGYRYGYGYGYDYGGYGRMNDRKIHSEGDHAQ